MMSFYFGDAVWLCLMMVFILPSDNSATNRTAVLYTWQMWFHLLLLLLLPYSARKSVVLTLAFVFHQSIKGQFTDLSQGSQCYTTPILFNFLLTKYCNKYTIYFLQWPFEILLFSSADEEMLKVTQFLNKEPELQLGSLDFRFPPSLRTAFCVMSLLYWSSNYELL